MMLAKAVAGIAMSICLGYIDTVKKWGIFRPIYGATYCIFLFSWFPQTASQQVFLGLTGAPWYVGSVLAFVTGMVIPVWIYKLIAYAKKNWKYGKILALLTGQ